MGYVNGNEHGTPMDDSYDAGVTESLERQAMRGERLNRFDADILRGKNAGVRYETPQQRQVREAQEHVALEQAEQIGGDE